jgi:serine/threonine protein kinase
MIGSTISHYKILEKLGEGGMGVVYKAQDTKLDRTVALKFLPSHLASSEQDKARFVQEAKAASALNHPNVCTIHAIEEHDGQLFIAMEFVDGQTLREKRGSISFKQAIDIGIQIADGLAAAHESGIVHRDIKPENIMIRKDGICQIMDFGLAKLRSASSKINRLTKEGSTVGTAGYMSPEQVQGQDVDHRSDIFSYGVLLHELLTGQLPFKGVHETAVAYEIVNVDAPPMSSIKPEIDASLDAIVLDCLEKDVNERSQSMRQISVDLKKYKRESSRQRASRVSSVRNLSSVTERQIANEPSQTAETAKHRRGIPAWVLIALLGISGFALIVLYMRKTEPASPIARVSILPAERTRVRGYASMAFSPDGSMLAYVAEDSTGIQRLWLRQLHSFTATPLNGTDGSFFPFWSPDNRSIGFFAGNKLKKIEVGGGSPLTLCTVVGASGGSWNSNGVIIFSSFQELGINKISANGGTPVLLAQKDTSAADLYYYCPIFLPDGKHFLYSTYTKPMVVTSRENDNGIYVGSLDSEERNLLMTGSSNAVIAENYLLYVRDNTLMAQAFDTDALALTGDPSIIAEQIMYFERFGVGSFTSSQTGMLAYLTRVDNLRGELVAHDRSGKIIRAFGQPSMYDDPRFAPDESRLAFTLYDGNGGRGDIWIEDIARGTRSRFTFSPTEEDDPVWSPDGSSIVFSVEGDIAHKASSGIGDVEILYQSQSDKVPNDWSSDGKYLAYCDFGAKTGRDLWVLPMTGERKPIPIAQTEFAEQYGQFSPDNSWISYSSNETGRHEIYVQSFPTLGGKMQVSTQGGAQAHWSANGKELYYVDLDGKLMVVDILRTGSSIQFGLPKLLFQTAIAGVVGPGHRYDVTRDGLQFVINDEKEIELRSEPINLVINWKFGLNK